MIRVNSNLESADLVTFTEEILSGKFHFLSQSFSLSRPKGGLDVWVAYDTIN